MNYGDKVVKWPNRRWENLKTWKRGERLLMLVEGVDTLLDAETKEILIPENAGDHVDFSVNLGLEVLLRDGDDAENENAFTADEALMSEIQGEGEADLRAGSDRDPVHQGRHGGDREHFKMGIIGAAAG